MVGIGIAACRSSYCACSPDTCCIPNEWQWIWNAPGCALHNVSMHMVHLRPDQFAPDSTYHFTGGPAYPPTDGKVSWGFVGDVWAAAECDDEAVNAGALVYCAMIDGQEAIVAEAFCFDPGQNIVGYKIGYTYDFSCDPFSFSIVTEDELCCGCNGDGGTNACIEVDCCDNCVPDTLYITVEYTSCGCSTNETIAVVYDDGVGRWVNNTWQQCSVDTAGIQLWCDAGTWLLYPLCAVAALSLTEVACDPLELTGTDLNFSFCCDGSIFNPWNVTVTE